MRAVWIERGGIIVPNPPPAPGPYPSGVRHRCPECGERKSFVMTTMGRPRVTDRDGNQYWGDDPNWITCTACGAKGKSHDWEVQSRALEQQHASDGD